MAFLPLSTRGCHLPSSWTQFPELHTPVTHHNPPHSPLCRAILYGLVCVCIIYVLLCCVFQYTVLCSLGHQHCVAVCGVPFCILFCFLNDVLTCSDGKVNRSEPVKRSTQLYRKKVHYLKLFKTCSCCGHLVVIKSCPCLMRCRKRTMAGALSLMHTNPPPPPGLN